jgi:hypothetical protein
MMTAKSLITEGMPCLERKDADDAIVKFSGAIKLDRKIQSLIAWSKNQSVRKLQPGRNQQLPF